jgi:trk system potassium uptake protein TrkH
MTIYPQQFVNEWGDIAILAVIIAMMFGGSACSTAGGFKGLRVGILFKALIQDTRRLLGSSKAIVIQKYHYHGDRTLGEQQVRSAALVVLMYMGIFAVGTLAGCMAGYPLLLSAFEAASATGNVGLTIGVSSPSMPAFLKLVYIFNMWAGRLEFMAILASAGFVASLFRGGRHVHA